MDICENPTNGIIVNCCKAWVYEEPDTDSDIVRAIPCLTRVTILYSLAEFSRISLLSGVEGFCENKFLAPYAPEDYYDKHMGGSREDL